MFYEEVFIRLNEAGVDYVVVGGLALNLHGIPRMTADLDLILDLKAENIKNFIETITELGYRPKLPIVADELIDLQKRREWVEQKGMRVFPFYHPHIPYQEIDVFIENPIDFSELNQAKELIIAGEVNIPVVSVEHLIRLKEGTGRKQDMSDIESLRTLQKIEEGLL